MRSYDYQYPVWTYTCAEGPNAGDILESPASSLSNCQPLCAVRNTSSNRVSLIPSESLPAKREANATTTNAHGIITREGWGSAINPSYLPEEKDGAPLLPYSRGERIWIEEGLLPTDEDDNIPVVSLDTGDAFRMPSQHICFVSDLKRTNQDGVTHYATIAGPVHTVIVNGQAWKIQGYFERNPHHSRHPALKWKRWRTGCSSGGLREFTPLKDEQEKRRVFENQLTNMWVDWGAWIDGEMGRSHRQLQQISPKPKRDEHLHTPPSRLPNPNLSKRALRMADIPYRPLERRPNDPVVSNKHLPRTSQPPPKTQHYPWSKVENGHSPLDQPDQTQDPSTPVVVDLKISFDPATKHVDVSSAHDSSEDYEMV